MNWFLPRKTREVLSESELIFASLKRNRIYTQDILAPRDLEAIEALEARYPALLKAKDVEGLEKLNKEAMKLGNRHFPTSAWDAWRENVEVFVVAAIMALAIRTYFLQPFKIGDRARGHDRFHDRRDFHHLARVYRRPPRRRNGSDLDSTERRAAETSSARGHVVQAGRRPGQLRHANRGPSAG
jgi:hypothetical protein